MQRIVKWNSQVSSTGVYAAINAYPTAIVAQSGSSLTVGGMIAAGTLVAYANTGASAGAVVPVYLGADQNYYPLTTATTVTGVGLVFTFQMTSPSPGLAIQITTAITGTVNLFCSVVIV